MSIAVNSNGRTALSASEGWAKGFYTAFRAGNAVGFALCSIGCLMLVLIVALAYVIVGENTEKDKTALSTIFECVTGFGLGGSFVALFGRGM